jgi:predicted NACHT family NTPase
LQENTNCIEVQAEVQNIRNSESTLQLCRSWKRRAVNEKYASTDLKLKLLQNHLLHYITKMTGITNTWKQEVCASYGTGIFRFLYKKY